MTKNEPRTENVAIDTINNTPNELGREEWRDIGIPRMKPATRNRYINKDKIKPILIERDGKCCNSCKRDCFDGVLQHNIEHKIALCNEGTNDIENLQILCVDCHKIKTREDLRILKENTERLYGRFIPGRFTEEQIKQIFILYYEKGLTLTAIGTTFNVNKETVGRVIGGITYKDISKNLYKFYTSKIHEFNIIEDLEGEIWKDVENFETFYAVSNKGRIKSKSRLVVTNGKKPIRIQERLLEPKQTKERNCITMLLSKNSEDYKVSLNKLIAEAFVQNPQKLPFVKNKDGNTYNNSVENLEWSTLGTDVDVVNQMLKDFYINLLSTKEIKIKHGVDSSSTYRILTGQSHVNITNKVADLVNVRNEILTENTKNETWLPLTDFENDYCISSKGRVVRLTKLINHYLTTGGYVPIYTYDGYKTFSVQLKNGRQKKLMVHTEIAKVFLKRNSPNHTRVKHIDGNNSNNNLTNLEWVTIKDHFAHLIKFGQIKVRKGWHSFVSEKQAKDIVNLYLIENLTLREIGRRFKTTHGNIRKVLDKNINKYGN